MDDAASQVAVDEPVQHITQHFVTGRDASHVVQLAGNGNVVLVVSGEGRWLHALAAANRPGTRGLGQNPYRSLDSFDERSSELFFGRTALTRKLIGRLERLSRADAGLHAPQRLIAIVGPSGCGKSSIANAGLIPAIAHSEAETLRNSEVLVFRPGQNPLASLVAVLLRRAPELGAAKDLEEELRRAGTAKRWSDLVAETPFVDDGRRAVILVVDQFEEVYALSSPVSGDPDLPCEAARLERSIFTGTLLAAANAPDSRIYVVLTVRSDFLAAIGEHQEISAAIAANHELVPPMDQAELEEAIGRPAALRRFPLHPSSVASLAEQALESPSALPLVQLALFQFWRTLEAEGEAGEDAAYRALKDLGGTIASSADQIMAGLPSDGARALAWQVLLDAVQIGNGGRDTKRRVELADVAETRTSLAELEEAIEPFVRERLLSRGGDAESIAGGWVEITHEALIQNWGELRRRLDQERSTKTFLDRAQQSAKQWLDKEGDLWRGTDLRRLRELAAVHGLTGSRARFLAASRTAERRWFWARLAALSVIGAVILGSGSYVLVNNQQRQAAESASLEARSLRIAQQAEEILSKAPSQKDFRNHWKDVSKSYFMAAQVVPWIGMGIAGRRPEVLEARYVFDKAASLIRGMAKLPAPDLRIVGISRDGEILAVPREGGGAASGRVAPTIAMGVLAFDPGEGRLDWRQTVQLVRNRDGAKVEARFSPDGTVALLTAVHVGTVPGPATRVQLKAGSAEVASWPAGRQPWDNNAGLPDSLRTISTARHGFGSPLQWAATKDGHEAAVIVRQGQGDVGVWRFRLASDAWTAAGFLPTPQWDSAATIRFSDDGQVLFGLSRQGSVFLWDLRQPTPDLVALRPAVEPVIGVAIPAAGGQVIAVGEASVSAWRLDEVLDRTKWTLAAEQALFELMPSPVYNCPSSKNWLAWGLLDASKLPGLSQSGSTLEADPQFIDQPSPAEPAAGKHICQLIRKVAG